MSNHKYRVYPCFLLPDTYFLLPFHATVRLCWTSSNAIEPTQSITKRSVDFQPYTHTHSMRCPHAYAMKCVITCYIMPYIYGQHNPQHFIHSYDFHTSFHSYDFHYLHMTSIHHFIHVNISCTHISTSTYNMSFYVQAMTHTIKPCNGHMHI